MGHNIHATEAFSPVIIPRATPSERLEWLLAELQTLLPKVHPDVRHVDVKLTLDDRNSPLPLMIVAEWATGSYQGDGVYSGGKVVFSDSRYRVTKKKGWHIDGEDCFSVVKVGGADRSECMVLSLTHLECFIGKKIAPASRKERAER